MPVFQPRYMSYSSQLAEVYRVCERNLNLKRIRVFQCRTSSLISLISVVITDVRKAIKGCYDEAGFGLKSF